MEFDPVLVHEWLRRTATRLPQKTALICGSEGWTYRMLDWAAERLAARFLATGLKRGDRIAVFLDNSIETVVCMYAALKAGGVFVVLDPALKVPKLLRILSEIDAHTLIAHARMVDTVGQVLDSLSARPLLLWVEADGGAVGHTADAEATWEDALAPGASEGDSIPHAGFPRSVDADLACLIYTSGSTGQPKGVMSTHHNVVSACRSIIQYLGNQERDVVLCALPLSFDYGLYQVLMSVMFGGTVVLERGFLYPHCILQKIAEHGVTGFPIVPSIMAILLRLDDPWAYDFGSLRYVTNTGGTLSEVHIRAFREAFPQVALFSMFGLTECKRVCYLPPADIDRLVRSVGRPMPNCEVSLLDDQGREVPPGQPGEMVIRGSNVMQGYWRDPEGTNRVFRQGAYPADRRLYTGDYFWRNDDGDLFFMGRRDDMIKCRGERISPREIEAVLLQMEGVEEAAVTGIPHDIDGQAIAAFIVVSSGRAIQAEEVRRHCARFLENTRVPRHVQFIEKIPRNGRGKVDWARIRGDDHVGVTP